MNMKVHKNKWGEVESKEIGTPHWRREIGVGT